jgi:hypothetical protein
MSMNWKYLYPLLLAGFFITGSHAQTASDALRYSLLEPGGTARTIGVGGAIGAMGADFATVGTNPAGLGAFRRSEAVFTPGLYNARVESTLLGAEQNVLRSEDRSNVHLNGIGIVFVTKPASKEWRNFNIGVGLNRMANFRQDMSFVGTSPGSITNRFIELADGLTPNQLDAFEAGLAYNTGAIYNPTQDNTIYSSDFAPFEPVQKSQIVRSSGSMNDFVFSMAGNYNDKLMIGTTISVPFLSYTENKTYRELDPNSTNAFFNELQFNENLITSGTGINLKIGAIFIPVHPVRLGLAVHTPTGFAMRESFSNRMTYDFDIDGANNRLTDASPDGSFRYRLRTPWRVVGSAGFLAGRRGFVSAEAEWIDYGKARYRFHQATTFDELEYARLLNDQIAANFRSVLAFRLGGELTLKEQFRLRAGYHVSSSPFEGDTGRIEGITLGGGLRTENFFLDLAFRNTRYAESYLPFLTSAPPRQVVDLNISNSLIVATIGFKFQ